MARKEFSDLPKWRQRRIRRLAKDKGMDVETFRTDRRKRWAKIVQAALGPVVGKIPGKIDDKVLEIVLDLIESADDE